MRSGSYLRYSIWLTALTVVVLIILLALTVYNVREQAIVELFSAQQASIAGQIASRTEESIAKCEKGMIMLSKLLSAEDISPEKKIEHIQALHAELQEIVLAIVEIDEDGLVVDGYPKDISARLKRKRFDDPAIEHALKKMSLRYTGEIRNIGGLGTGQRSIQGKAIGIGMPIIGAEGKYNGALLAIMPPQLILGRSIPIDRTYMNDFWLVDESGRIIFHPNQDILAHDITKMSPQGDRAFKMFSYNPVHYSELTLSQKGVDVRCIIAYAPVRIGIEQWWIVLVTPYDKILKPIRSASLNIILGAIGLISVVVVTTVSIARSDVKRARLKEELKRLKEREVWQGKLLREKKTVEGIIEGSPVPTFVLDNDHRVILWNRACTDLTGYSSKEMIGTRDYYKPFYHEKRPFLADFIIDGNTDAFKHFYGEGKVMKSETIEGAYEAIKDFTNVKGKDRHMHFLAAPIFDEKGEIVAAIETFLDVTKEVELTNSLQEYAETLQNELEENIRLGKEVEELYNYLLSIVDSLPDKIYEINRDGIINFASRQIRDRRSRYDPKGKHFTEHVAPEHRAYALSKFEDAKKGIFKPYELEMTARDGTKKLLMMTPGPLKGTDRFVLVERDITELKDLEKKYYESQKLAAIGQLSAGIAHEVRNPLSSIKMSLQILEKRMQPEGNDLKRFKIAQREVDHLEKLVSDVLIYAKPLDPHKEPSDMRAVVEGALAMVEKSLKDKNIEVHKRFPEDLRSIPVDQAMLRQALINLFQNASDAMEPGGQLTISLKDMKHLITIEIEDNGCGIAEDDLPHLFNPFFTRKSYGTGLGLTQVKKIVDQHGGEIEVTSKMGEGTRFIISLPRDS
ncbi:MAG TPA: ATP-binding protein [Deltaproteobacteria bacterium]|nr:ATP-binding protein [Deltaproteobacteria bacterium]